MTFFKKGAAGRNCDGFTVVHDSSFNVEVNLESHMKPLLLVATDGGRESMELVGSIADTAKPFAPVEVLTVDVLKNPHVRAILETNATPSVYSVSRGTVLGELVGADITKTSVCEICRDLLDKHISGHMEAASERAGLVSWQHRTHASDDERALAALDLLESCSDPAAELALLAVGLITRGAVTAHDLAKAGITPDELSGFFEALKGGRVSQRSDFARGLEVAAALREHRKNLEAIGTSLGMTPGSDELEQLGQRLAKFALENEIDDIKIAFRLMKAEGLFT